MPAAWLEGGRVHGGYVPGAADDGYPPLGVDEGPLFFLSYVHGPRDDRTGRDPDLWVGQLYEDLCDHIKSLTDLPPGMKAGFMDRELREHCGKEALTHRKPVPLTASGLASLVKLVDGLP